MNSEPNRCEPIMRTWDERYLAGITHFNRQEYFEAHEIWEDLWNDCEPADRRFYQALIQAAVSLYHSTRNNEIGARRLFESGRRYMEPYRPVHHGLEIDAFWLAVEARLQSCEIDAPRISLRETYHEKLD